MQLRPVLTKIMLGACALLTPFAAFAATNGELTISSPQVQTAIVAQNSVTPDLMQRSGVLGTAVGLNDDGSTNVTVFVDRETKNVADVVSSLPAQIGNVKVHVEITDKF